MADNKLKITAYKDNSFKSQVGQPYVVRYNPTNIDHTFNIEYDQSQAEGSSGTENKYSHTKPETLKFELLFDKTFVAAGDFSDTYKVDDALKKFKKTVIDYNGDIHRPNYVKLLWGDLSFKGQVTEFSVNYTAFTSEGKALKAKVNITFTEVQNIKERVASENKSSPDLTHIITIKQGDTLPRICNNIYSDPLYYLEIARINKLDSFRQLKAGDRIILPPVDK